MPRLENSSRFFFAARPRFGCLHEIQKRANDDWPAHHLLPKRRWRCRFRKFPCYSPELVVERIQSWHEAPRGDAMWADAETEVDFLNYSEVVELVAELIGTPDLMPLS